MKQVPSLFNGPNVHYNYYINCIGIYIGIYIGKYIVPLHFVMFLYT